MAGDHRPTVRVVDRMAKPGAALRFDALTDSAYPVILFT